MNKSQKIFLPDNIKFLRERKKISQESLAEQLDISRVKLNAIESGKTRNPPLEDLISFSTFFRVSIDSLLKANLSKLLEIQLRELEKGNDVYMMGTHVRVLAITVDNDNKENAEYVPVKAKMGYQAGYNDPKFIAALPKYNIPSLPRHGTYRTFPAEGDSMYPIPDKAEVTGAFIENWMNIKPDTPCIVVLNGNNDFVFKLVTVNKKEKSFLLRSLNPEFKPYTVEAGAVLELWEFRQLHLETIPEPATDLEVIKQMVSGLREEIRNLKK